MAERDPGGRLRIQKKVFEKLYSIKNIIDIFVLEIIKFVKSPDLLQHGVFRPALNTLNIPNYIRNCLRLCWDEDPEVRPDIRLVRMHLKELQAGLLVQTINLFVMCLKPCIFQKTKHI